MKKIVFTLFILCSASGLLFAQDTVYLYYDNNWVEILNKNEAAFYRKAFPQSNNAWDVNDFYMSNKIQMTGTYKSKKLTVRNGHFIYYFENGNKTSEGDYTNDKLNGPWTYWHENGLKKSQGTYTDNLKTGTWNYYDENNRLLGIETYNKAGTGSIVGFHENGEASYKGNFGNEGPEGYWTYWNSDGRITLTGNYRNGIRDGEWTRSFRDGDTKIVYKYGVPEGKRFGGIVRND